MTEKNNVFSRIISNAPPIFIVSFLIRRYVTSVAGAAPLSIWRKEEINNNKNKDFYER